VVGRQSRGGHPPTERVTSIREVHTSWPGGVEKLQGQNRFERRLHLRPMGAGAPALSSLSVLHVAPPSPTELLTRRGAPPLQVGRGCSATGTAADSGKVTPLLPSKVVSRHKMPAAGTHAGTAITCMYASQSLASDNVFQGNRHSKVQSWGSPPDPH
jgi:hypothetical protein